jgi:hypothetical protein
MASHCSGVVGVGAGDESIVHRDSLLPNQPSRLTISDMADIPLRLNSARDIKAIKVLRLNRKNNRGEYINLATGEHSRDRRGQIIDPAVRRIPGTTAPIDRRRLRRGWTLTDALQTAFPSAS